MEKHICKFYIFRSGYKGNVICLREVNAINSMEMVCFLVEKEVTYELDGCFNNKKI